MTPPCAIYNLYPPPMQETVQWSWRTKEASVEWSVQEEEEQTTQVCR